MSPSNPLLSAPAADGTGRPGGGGGGGTGIPVAGGGEKESSPDPGIGGGGGAPEEGMGGGGGAAIEGIGGGGGGSVVGGWPMLSSKLPCIDGMLEGDMGVSMATAGVIGLSTVFFSSIAERGRGGAIVPNSIDASCFALPPVTLSGPSSSSEEDVESTTDHSSSSCLRRDASPPVGVEARGGKG